MTQIPWFDEVWYKSSFTAMLRKTTGFSILSIVGKFIAERQEARKSNQGIDEPLGDRDMLSQFFEIQAKNTSLPPWCVSSPSPPNALIYSIKLIPSRRCVTAWTFSNVIAGSDSTAVILRTVWYNLLANPHTMHRLREELLEARTKKPGGFSKPYPSWKDVCDLPYLDACINEGIRLHPPFCLPFERVVPKGGIMIGDNYFPEGTVVGMSPYVVNRHKPTFGEDADVWNPERWMVPEGRKRKLEASLLTVSIFKSLPLVDSITLPLLQAPPHMLSLLS